MCGTCIRLTSRSTGTSIFVTAVDLCGDPPSGFDAHFDIAQPAFIELFGQQGIDDGNGAVEWSTAPSSSCGGSLGSPPDSSPLPIPFKSVTSGVRPSGLGVICGGVRCQPGSCCSKWDWCGSGADFCGSGCTGGSCWNSDDTSGSDTTGSDNSGFDNSGFDNSGFDNSGFDNSGSDNSGANPSFDDGSSDFSMANDAGSVSENSPDADDNDTASLPGWGIGLIVLGCLIVALGLALIVVFFLKK